MAGVRPIAPRGFYDPQQGAFIIFRKGDVSIKRLWVPSRDQKRTNELFSEEAVVWKKLNHPNIVPFKGLTLDPIELISEWVSSSGLREYIRENSSVNRPNLLLGVSNGLDYLHSHEIIHGDLSGSSVLVDASWNARITDFGLAKIAQDPSTAAGAFDWLDYTSRWTAPEIFRGTATPNKETDMFSFSMVVVEVFTGKVPFPERGFCEVGAAIVEGDRPSRPDHPDLTEKLWELTQECWEPLAKDRPGVVKAVEVIKETIEEYTPSPKATPEESPVETQRLPTMVVPDKQDIEALPYDVETPLPAPAQPSQEVKEKISPVLEETQVVSGGTTNEPALRLPSPIDNDGLPTKNSEVEVEEGRERHKHLRGVDDNLVGFEGRNDPDSEWKSNLAGGDAKEENVVPAERPPDPKDTVEEVREPPAPLTSVKEDEDAEWQLGVGLTSFPSEITARGLPDRSGSTTTGLPRTNAPSPSRPTTREPPRQLLSKVEGKRPLIPIQAEVPPEEGLTSRSGSTSVVNPQPNIIPLSDPLTPEPPAHHDRNTAIPPTPGSSTRVNVKKLPHPSTPTSNFEGEPTVHLPTTTEENQSGDQTSDPHAVFPDSEKMDQPTGQESDRSTPQTQIHHQTDVRHAALPSQLPISTSYQWRALLDPKRATADFDNVLSGVSKSPTEIEGIKESTTEDLQCVVDVLGEYLVTKGATDWHRKEHFKLLCEICATRGVLPKQYRLDKSRLKWPKGDAVDGGGSGSIWKGKYGGVAVAIKKLDVTRQNIPEKRQSFCHEVIPWKMLSHENTLRFLGAYMIDCDMVMVSDWMKNGHIKWYLERKRPSDKLPLLVDVACGLEYLHNMDVIHGDLKGLNILVKDDGRACLADFGLMSITLDLAADLTTAPERSGGTYRWTSPELFDPKRFKLPRAQVTKETDCYALGMVIYEVLLEKLPFYEDKDSQMLCVNVPNGKRPTIPKVIDPGMGGLWELVQECWSHEPSKRPPSPAILSRLNSIAPTKVNTGPKRPQKANGLWAKFKCRLWCCGSDQFT